MSQTVPRPILDVAADLDISREHLLLYGDDKAKFNAADLNQDGRLTHDEYHNLLGHGSS